MDVVGVPASTLSVYLGKGDGTFGSPISSNLGSTATVGQVLLFGDFNGDGKVDVAIGNLGSGTGILLGNGDATFQTGVFPANLNNFFAQLTAEVNNDGKLDQVTPSGQVALGNGDSTFTVLPTIYCQVQPAWRAGYLRAWRIADVNGDGKPDMIIADDQDVFTQIYLGNGDGTFTYAHAYMPQLQVPDGAGATSGLAVGDFNSDGKSDIVFNEAVLLGNGDGTFQGIPLGFVGDNQLGNAAVTGDFDKNGTVDVAMACGSSVCIFSNDGAGNLTLTHTYGLQQSGLGIVTADFNGDGKLDLLVLELDLPSNDWSYSVLLGNGDGSFQSPVYNPQSVAGANPAMVIVADFNQDGKPDIGTTISGQFAVLLGYGDGTFKPPGYYFDAGYSSLMAADFIEDGKLDIAVGNTGGLSGTAILFGNGDGTFQTAVLPANLNSNFAVQFTGDLNNDGKADLVSYFYPTSQVALGNGDGTFNVLPAMAGLAVIYCDVVAIADINGDGKLDAIVSETLSRTGITLDIRLGNGDGPFGSDIGVQSNGQNPLVADMNGDGQPDLVFPSTIGAGDLLNTTAPGFSIGAASGSPTSQTIGAGQTVRFSLVLAPTGEVSGTVNLSCAITPPAAASAPTCTLSSTSVQISGGNSQPVTVKVGTIAATTTGAVPPIDFPSGGPPIVCAVMLLGSGCLLLRKRKWLPRLAPVILLASAFSTAGCGGSSSSAHTTPGTPTGTYTATITATSASLNRSMTFTVIVN